MCAQLRYELQELHVLKKEKRALRGKAPRVPYVMRQIAWKMIIVPTTQWHV
jgi:hypothetical protein